MQNTKYTRSQTGLVSGIQTISRFRVGAKVRVIILAELFLCRLHS